MNILVISAHPDDETLGCGGSLLNHLALGDAIYWLILTKAHYPQWSANAIKTKEDEVNAVANAYGMKQVFWPAFPSTQLDAIPLNDIIAEIRRVVETVRPQLIYTVHHGDIHTDHQVVFQATTIVLKPFYMRKLGVQRLQSFECLSSTDAALPFQGYAFIPNVFKDITPYIERKLEIMQLYQTEIQVEPQPRSQSAIQALARYRGSTVGVNYAEAFMLIREVS